MLQYLGFRIFYYESQESQLHPNHRTMAFEVYYEAEDSGKREEGGNGDEYGGKDYNKDCDLNLFIIKMYLFSSLFFFIIYST